MKKVLILTVLFLSQLFPATTFAESESKKLLKRCEDLLLLVDKNAPSHKKNVNILYDAGYCQGLVRGVGYGMALFADPENDYKACPDNISQKDYLKTVMQYLKNNPYDNNEDSIIVATALYQKYRCKMATTAQDAPVTLQEVRQVCEDQERMAQSAVYGRESGWSLSKSLEGMRGNAARRIIRQAYERPDLGKMEFGRKIYRDCINSAPSNEASKDFFEMNGSLEESSDAQKRTPQTSKRECVIDCEELLYKGELAHGVTLQQCIHNLCD